uniref:Uncharacterized protein n=1 Tax=Aureimonas frigidaquae TaxID=424757 RepID=A0A0P0Z120_9HYPH|nr:hypothetical protein [Aureimonas frigidaquae]
MDDTAVMAGLVRGKARLLLQKEDARARLALKNGAHRGKAHDTAADNREIEPHDANRCNDGRHLRERMAAGQSAP